MNATYKSILTVCTGFLGLFLLLEKEWLLYVSLSVGTISLLSHSVAVWVEKSWEYLGKGLGYVNSKILLSLIYLIFVIPIAVLYKISKRKTLEIDNSGESMWSKRNYIFKKTDLEKTW